MPHRQSDQRHRCPSWAVRSRPTLWLAAVLVALTVPLLSLVSAPSAQAGTPTTTSAATCSGTAIEKTLVGVLKNSADSGKAVPDVKITVTACDGKTYDGTTTPDGRFSIKFSAGIGPTKVSLDPDTLPEGVKMRSGAKTEITLQGTTSLLSVSFLIGPDNRKVESTWGRIPGLVYSGLLFGIILAMGALGLSMIFGTTGLTNFAHGELVSFGAIVTYWLSSSLGLPFLLAVPLTVLLAMVFGWAQDAGLWRPLRRRGTGLIAAMIVSIGAQFFLRNLYAYLTGSRTLTYNQFYTPKAHTLFGVDYTLRDIVVALVSIAVILAVIFALSYTRLGRATRAVADNPALAASTGINVDRVISIVWIGGTALAALSGIFMGFQLGVTYQIGQLILLLLFAAGCLGGLGSVWGAVVGSLIIGVLIDLSTLVISADLKNAGALLLLILILLLRPQGLLGRRERIG